MHFRGKDKENIGIIQILEQIILQVGGMWVMPTAAWAANEFFRQKNIRDILAAHFVGDKNYVSYVLII